MSVNTNRIKFLNTYIDSLTSTEAKAVVESFVKDGKKHYVVTPNSDIVVKMQEDQELKTICDNADLILADGQMLVMISEVLKNPIVERVCMTDFIWDVLDLANEKNYRVFLLGGKEDALQKATARIKNQYPKLNIVDTYSPPFGFENDIANLNVINERIKISRADILIVFLGCPKQEKFIANNMNKYCVPVSIPMGGCIDFIAGSVKRAPLWMQKLGLEWFYRFIQEPQRLFKRYFIDDIKIFKLTIIYKFKRK